MKLTRYDGHVPLFSQNMEGRERTLFGSTVQDDDINNQFTPEFLRGWGSVGSTEFPTLQDFNALAYTHNKLLSYLYQAGIPSYTQNEEYYIGSIVQYNKDIYICLIDNPTVLPTDANAWKRVQESLTFVGIGPEVMKVGAGGILGSTIRNTKITGNAKSGLYTTNNAIEEESIFPNNFSYNMIVLGYQHDRMNGIAFNPTGNYAYIYSSINKSISMIYNDFVTRKDKNNVIHAGTTTPINTLNVSDMSQEVIDNDLLTVTSGAVYRAIQPKADSTYVNTELGKKADKTYVDSELLKKADLTYVDTELDKKITGGNVVQPTGQSTIDVMSQKGVSDTINNLNIDYALVDFGVISNNQRYVKSNPFGSIPVITKAEIFVDNEWQEAKWGTFRTSPLGVAGTSAGQRGSDLIVQTLVEAVSTQSNTTGSLTGNNTLYTLKSAKCRMHVWRLKK